MGEQEKTQKELREELVKLGFDAKATEGIKTKEALLATIEAMKAKAVVSLNPANPQEDRDTEKSWQTKADRMAKHLEAQPKIRVLIPLETNEKVGIVEETLVKGIRKFKHISGAVWSKTFNGYKVIYPKGMYVDVPEQIAENIGDEQNQTQNAGASLKIDRMDTNTGRPVSEQLR